MSLIKKQPTDSIVNVLPEQNPAILENLFCLGRKVLAEPNKYRALQAAMRFAAEQSGTEPVEIILYHGRRVIRIEPSMQKRNDILREQSLLFAERCKGETCPVLLRRNTGVTTVLQSGIDFPKENFEAMISAPILKDQSFFGIAVFSTTKFPGDFAIYLLQAFGAFIADTAAAFIAEQDIEGDICDQERELRERFDFEHVVGHNKELIELLRLVSMVAPSDATILIQGETGTGKEVIAQAIYRNSDRTDNVFVPINCGAIPEHLLESELFGHTKGAFTSATDAKAGWFEKAHNGTVFLDEISEMSPALQVKLLRILQTGEFSRVGSTEIQHSDVRIIAATNRVLEELVREGTFRDDLYYRLNVIDLNIPPLRDRKDDIPALAQHFLNKYAAKYDKYFLQISDEVMQTLQSYDYPGNCRELENIIQAAVILAGGDEIHLKHLTKLQPESRSRPSYMAIHGTFKDSKQFVVEQFEQNFIKQKLEASSGNISQAARSSGMDVKNFHTKMTKYGIDATIYK
mgnify:CR=1 FL=1